MSEDEGRRYELRRVTTAEWVILDLSLPIGHPRRQVAAIYEIDPFEYDVVCLEGVDLRSEASSPEEVLDELLRTNRPVPRDRASRPVPIPHVRPREWGSAAPGAGARPRAGEAGPLTHGRPGKDETPAM